MSRWSVTGKHPVVFAALVLLMAATRFHHVGSAFGLPDASLMVFLAAGLFLPAAAFIALLGLAAGIDALSLALGTSGYCVSISYAALPLAYAAPWLAGRWLAGQAQRSSRALLWQAPLLWWLSMTVAFSISNGSFYWFSGRFAEPHWLEYSARVVQFYPGYLSRTLPYALLMQLALTLWVWRAAPRPVHG